MLIGNPKEFTMEADNITSLLVLVQLFSEKISIESWVKLCPTPENKRRLAEIEELISLLKAEWLGGEDKFFYPYGVPYLRTVKIEKMAVFAQLHREDMAEAMKKHQFKAKMERELNNKDTGNKQVKI